MVGERKGVFWAAKRPFHTRGGDEVKVVCSCRSHQGFRKGLGEERDRPRYHQKWRSKCRVGIGRRDLNAVDAVRGLERRG
ncbi:hypothetical protein CEXT_759321 [Caerostris extrusa]|uniref:Uncharacterized protein n=1 Tax=Caerostris extrusa TaxID=172846 RepID=A0AAV4VKF3_CAEEX|nr:hypothetical protein CEXT_759321 [Caerostris extrusa]